MIEEVGRESLGMAGFRTARDTIRFIETHLRFPNGRPFVLFPWQKRWILECFRECLVTFHDTSTGRRWQEVRRIVGNALITIPRKNGKSGFIAALATAFLYGPLWERGMEIVCAATTRDQAKLVHKEAGSLMRASPLFQKDGTFRYLERSIFSEEHNVSFKPVASRESGVHGLNCNVIFLDEIARLPDLRIFDTLDEATSTRPNSLIICFSTMDERESNPMTDLIGNVRAMDMAGIDTSNWLVLEHKADLDDDPDPLSDNNMLRANPSAPYLPELMRKLEEDRDKARVSDHSLSRWITTRLNIAGSSETQLVDPLKWKRCAHPDGRAHLDSFGAREEVCVGVDLSRSRDLTAIGLWFPERRFLDAMCFLPASQIAVFESRHKLPFRQWVEKGHLIACEGPVVDYRVVSRYLGKVADRFDVLRTRFDAWNVQSLKEAMHLEDVTMPVEEVRIGAFTMDSYMVKFENLVESEGLQHSNSPILNYCVASIAAKPYKDSLTGIRKPVKAYSNSLIDAGIAGMLAVGNKVGAERLTLDDIILEDD